VSFIIIFGTFSFPIVWYIGRNIWTQTYERCLTSASLISCSVKWTWVELDITRGGVAIRYVLPVLWMTSCEHGNVQAKTTQVGRLPRVTHRGQHRSGGEVWRLPLHCYSAPDRGAEYCDERVCLSVCVFFSVRDHTFGTTSPILNNFSACYPWPWLGPPLAALWYVMFFRFYGWRNICS